MRKIYKVGVIGTGDISTQYLTNAKNVKMFKDYYQIVAVADLVVEKAQAKAAEFGVPKYGLPEIVYNDKDSIAAWAVEWVQKCSTAGIFKGDTQGNFNPQNNANRCEAATVFYRCYQKYVQ
jgi:predicted homoserine dehydrogenase-like protein